MHLAIFLLIAAHAAAFYLTADIDQALAKEATSTTGDVPYPTTATITATKMSSPVSSISFSSLMTIAPLSRNPLEARQKCFNDQGFSVNCAAWTGYYYTWGGAGHPYEGGPGDSGNSGDSARYRGDASSRMIGIPDRFDRLKWPALVALTVVCLLVLL